MVLGTSRLALKTRRHGQRHDLRREPAGDAHAGDVSLGAGITVTQRRRRRNDAVTVDGDGGRRRDGRGRATSSSPAW